MARSSGKQTSMRRSNPSPKSEEEKVGSEPQAVRGIGGKGDFGAPAGDRRQREYASHETRQNDPGAANTRLKTGERESRESGVGSNDSGPGSGSGGDVDMDIIGVGTGRQHRLAERA